MIKKYCLENIFYSVVVGFTGHSTSKLNRLLLCLLLFLLFGNSYAQVFPMQGSLQITPPYSPYLSDYTTAGEQKLTLQLRPNDITLGDHPVRLRLIIEGVGITIRTKANYVPPVPHTLMGGGAPTLFYGEDLLDYFNPDNLDFAGFSRSDFQQSGKLPEGVYRFSFEVLDYYRQVSLSSKIITVAWIVLNDPPLLNLPLNHTKVTLIDPTNIAFTWTPRHTSSPNSAFTTEYVFKLVEVWPVSRNPYDAFLSQPALYETTLTESQLLYGPAEPALLPGRKYAWQVQARDEEGRDVFKNQGKSEVFVFQFGDLLGIPENLRKEGGNDQALTLVWEPAGRGETPDRYNIRYKAVAADNWSETLCDKQWVTLTGLQPNTDYEAQVRGKRDDIYSDYTPLLRVKTTEKAANFTCGQPPATVNTDKNSRLLQLTPGDVFTCNDWRIVVTEATRSTNGEYAGKGMMAVKMFSGASIEVIFHGAINASYQLITGGVESLYNKGSEMGSVVEEMKKIGEKKKAPPTPPTDTTAITPITFPGIIDSVYFDKEKKEVVVVDKEGKKTTYPQKTDPKTQEAKPMQITDAAGNTVTVGKDGTVTKGGKGGEAGGTGGNTTASIDPQVNILMKEILASFSKDIDDYLVKKPPGKKGPTADLYDDYLSKPDCLPDDAEALRSIKAYSNELQNNSDQLDQFVNTILQKEENRTYFNDLVKKTLDDYKQKKSYKETLSTEEYNKVRETTCPYLVEEAEQMLVITQIAVCLGAAALDVAINYTFKWVELNFLDQETNNDFSLLDFSNIWATLNKGEIAASAGEACASAILPAFLASKSKARLIVIVTASFGTLAVEMAADISAQYDSLKGVGTFSEKFSHLDWGQSFRRAGIQALISGVSAGIATYAIDHPAFRNLGTKLKNLGYLRVKQILHKTGFSNETIKTFCKKWGVRKVAKAGNIWDDIIVKGKKGIVEVLSSQYKNIYEYLAGAEYGAKIAADFVKYQARGGLSDLASYTTKHKVITQNRMTGKIAEDVFTKFESGIKPRRAIQTSDGARYIDNLLDGTAREIKSGRITLNGTDFQRQIKKDIEIIKRQLSTDIQKIEWHALDGIDDNALQFIRAEMTNQGLTSDLFKVIIY